MAVYCTVPVDAASQKDAIALEEQVTWRLEAAGAPPDGLMFLAVFPDAGGFTIAMAYRTGELARAEIDDHMRSDAAAVGLTLGESAVRPIWSMACPVTSLARLMHAEASGQRI